MFQYTTRRMGRPSRWWRRRRLSSRTVVVDPEAMGALVAAHDPPAVFTAAEDAELAEGHSAQRTIEASFNRALSSRLTKIARRAPTSNGAKSLSSDCRRRRSTSTSAGAAPRHRTARCATTAAISRGRCASGSSCCWRSSTSSPTARPSRWHSTRPTSGRRSSTRTCWHCCRSAWCSRRCSRPNG